jgi:hypothetical protein
MRTHAGQPEGFCAPRRSSLKKTATSSPHCCMTSASGYTHTALVQDSSPCGKGVANLAGRWSGSVSAPVYLHEAGVCNPCSGHIWSDAMVFACAQNHDVARPAYCVQFMCVADCSHLFGS